ncbi:MAG TPA: hypothetical protein EYP49_02735 [Anaerolineae bacterium]|nr:hypothetical protein [Anaerolineae bacterium]
MRRIPILLVIALMIMITGCGPFATPFPVPTLPSVSTQPAGTPWPKEVAKLPSPPQSVKLELEQLPQWIQEHQSTLREKELAVARRGFPTPIREYYLSNTRPEDLKAFYQQEVPPQGWEPDPTIGLEPLIERPDYGEIIFYFKKSIGGALFRGEVHIYFSAEHGWEEFDGPWRGKVFVIILQKRVI